MSLTLDEKIDNLTEAFHQMELRLAVKCATEEQRICTAERDINRAFVKIRGIWGWVVGGTGFITALLTLFYFLLSAHGGK
jgi:hypothetical protein